MTYRIVGITIMSYYSENQIFCFLKSRILTRGFFLGKKTFLFVIRSLRSCVCQVARISKRFNHTQKVFCLKKNWHVTIPDFKKQKI